MVPLKAFPVASHQRAGKSSDGIFIGSKGRNKSASCAHLWSPAPSTHQGHQELSHFLNVPLPEDSSGILANGQGPAQSHVCLCRFAEVREDTQFRKCMCAACTV